MDIKVVIEDTKATIKPVGKLTVQTAPELDDSFGSLGTQVCDLTIDLSELEYISSAGLRVLVSTQKAMTARGGSLVLLKPNDDVYEVFDMTGLNDVFDIER